MGNSISNQTDPKNIKSLSQTIDDIAIHYILKQNVIDLLRLTDKEYYDNLIILIGKVFDTRLTNLEIGVLSGRINETIQEAIFSLLPATDNIKNKMISNISKFYIKLMMIYSAIVATIDPQYSYEDEQGQKQFFYLKDVSLLKKIPRESNPVLHQLTNPMNLCRKRITILKNKLETNDEDFIVLNPGEKLCSIDSATKLTDEVGIKELDLLYYDIFDYSNKSWKKRSREMEEKYKNDLTLFYKIFTGKATMPNEINSFKDIELLDFKSIEYCNDPLFKQDFTVSKNDSLIRDYIEQIHIIEEEVKVYRTKLTDILKTIFLIKMTGDEQTYTINPSLTMPQILKLEEDTRNTIISLYTNCERNFIKALLIFEEIYDKQSRDSQQKRYNNIEMGNVDKGVPGSLNTTSFSNFDKVATPEPNKDALFRSQMSITTPPNSQASTFSFGPSPNPFESSVPLNGSPEAAPVVSAPATNASMPLEGSPEASAPLNGSPEAAPATNASMPLEGSPPVVSAPLNGSPELSSPELSSPEASAPVSNGSSPEISVSMTPEVSTPPEGLPSSNALASNGSSTPEASLPSTNSLVPNASASMPETPAPNSSVTTPAPNVTTPLTTPVPNSSVTTPVTTPETPVSKPLLNFSLTPVNGEKPVSNSLKSSNEVKKASFSESFFNNLFNSKKTETSPPEAPKPLAEAPKPEAPKPLVEATKI